PERETEGGGIGPAEGSPRGGNGWRRSGVGELLVLDAVRLVRLGAEAALAVGLIAFVVALEPDHLRVALEGQNVGGDTVEEPAVVADHHRAAGEGDERIFQSPQGVDVE